MGNRGSAYRPFKTSRALTAAALIWTASFTQGAVAEEIVRWVDAEGVTHFSDPHLAAAPAKVVEIVEVQPTNGMAVPTPLPSSVDGRPSFTKLSMPESKNKRGWRGYQSTRRGGRGYRR
jgi:hypothetical protein